MTHVFEIQIKKRGRIVIPSNVRKAARLEDGDWVVIQLDKMGRKEKAKP